MDCVEDADCPSTQFFFCDTVTSRCTVTCRSDFECNARPAEFALAECAQGLGCRCDRGACAIRLCSADSECGAGLACRNGACVAPPEAGTITGCVVSPDFKLLRPGQQARFHVLAWDAQQAPVIIPSGATWTLPDGATAYGNEVVVLAPATSSFTIRAGFGGISCDAKGQVTPQPAAGEVLAVVIDERTGRPISSAKVVMSARDGSVLQQVESDAMGAARLRQPAAEFSVTVFHADFSYLTIANVAATTSHLTLAVRRNPFDRFGGFTGTFANVPQTSNLHLARVGWSIGDELARLDLSDPPRPWVTTDVPTWQSPTRAEVPAGSFLGFGGQQIKNDVWALGTNGTCLGATGQPDEAAITDGACGTGSAWALAMDVPMGDFPADLVTSDQFSVLHRLPGLHRAASWVQRDVPFTLRPTPGADAGAFDISSRSEFTTVSPEFGQMPLAFDFRARLPWLPQYLGAPVARVFAVGGALVPGRGFVPLGLATGANVQPVDRFVDYRMPDSEAGQVRVRMAPTHHGLEGAPYVLVTQASSSPEPTNPLEGKALSAIVSRFAGNVLPFEPESVSADLSADAFPPVPEGARFDWQTRAFRLSARPAGVSLLRVSFSDSLPTHWEVLVDPSAPSFTLPEVPGTLRDRLFANGERSRWSVQAQRLEGLDTFAEVLEATEPPVLTGFSYEEKRPVRVVLESAPEVTRGSQLRLSVEGFIVGTGPEADGVLAVTFTGGTNCPSQVLESPPSGWFQLAFNCVGPSVTVRAELMRADGTTPISPPVAWTVTVAIR